MSLSVCQCGVDAKHEHSIDGDRQWYCPDCHAVIKYITRKPGMSLALAVKLAKDDPQSVLDEYSREEPVPLGLEVSNSLPKLVNSSSPVAVQAPSGKQFFVPLKDHHNEIRRQPPAEITVN